MQEDQLKIKLAAMFRIAVGALSNPSPVLSLMLLDEFSNEELDLIDGLAQQYEKGVDDGNN